MKRSWAARAGALLFWLAVWQTAAMAVGQEVFLVSPVRALETLVRLLPTGAFWSRVGFSSGRVLLGFFLGAACSVPLAAAAYRLRWVELLLAPVIQLVKATPVASFIILALVWVRGKNLSILIGFLMVLPVLYGAVRTGLESADPQLLEMARVSLKCSGYILLRNEYIFRSVFRRYEPESSRIGLKDSFQAHSLTLAVFPSF